MASAIFSPIIIVVTLMLARTQSGMIDASATRIPSRPWTIAMLVHDGHCVGGRPHLVRAGDVVACRDLAHHPGIEDVIRLQGLVGRLDSLVQDAAPRLMLTEPDTNSRTASRIRSRSKSSVK